LDILVNNAGVAYMGDIESLTMEQFDRLVAINVKGVFAAIQRAVPHLGNTAASSTSAASTPTGVPGPGLSIICDVEGSGRRVDARAGPRSRPRGITVNNIQPGSVATDMNPEVGEFADSLRR
jgi:3-oxoacyl-[acyl-carrier protein] reductase